MIVRGYKLVWIAACKPYLHLAPSVFMLIVAHDFIRMLFNSVANSMSRGMLIHYCSGKVY